MSIASHCLLIHTLTVTCCTTTEMGAEDCALMEQPDTVSALPCAWYQPGGPWVMCRGEVVMW